MKITIHQRQIEALFHRAAQAAETKTLDRKSVV